MQHSHVCMKSGFIHSAKQHIMIIAGGGLQVSACAWGGILAILEPSEIGIKDGRPCNPKQE